MVLIICLIARVPTGSFFSKIILRWVENEPPLYFHVRPPIKSSMQTQSKAVVTKKSSTVFLLKFNAGCLTVLKASRYNFSPTVVLTLTYANGPCFNLCHLTAAQ